MTQITFIMPQGSTPQSQQAALTLLANICGLMSPWITVTTHNVITPLNSLLPSALWLLLPAAHQLFAQMQLACIHCRARQGGRGKVQVQLWLFD